MALSTCLADSSISAARRQTNENADSRSNIPAKAKAAISPKGKARRTVGLNARLFQGQRRCQVYTEQAGLRVFGFGQLLLRAGKSIGPTYPDGFLSAKANSIAAAGIILPAPAPFRCIGLPARKKETLSYPFCRSVQNFFRFGKDLPDDLRCRLFLLHHSGYLPCEKAAVLFVAFYRSFPQRACTESFQFFVGYTAIILFAEVFSRIRRFQATHRMPQPFSSSNRVDILRLQDLVFIGLMYAAFFSDQKAGPN